MGTWISFSWLCSTGFDHMKEILAHNQLAKSKHAPSYTYTFRGMPVLGFSCMFNLPYISMAGQEAVKMHNWRNSEQLGVLPFVLMYPMDLWHKGLEFGGVVPTGICMCYFQLPEHVLMKVDGLESLCIKPRRFIWFLWYFETFAEWCYSSVKIDACMYYRIWITKYTLHNLVLTFV